MGDGSCAAVRGSKDNFQESLLSPMWVPGTELSSVGKYLDPMSHLTDPRGTFNFENCFKLCPCVSVRMLASAHEYRPPRGGITSNCELPSLEVTSGPLQEHGVH